MAKRGERRYNEKRDRGSIIFKCKNKKKSEGPILSDSKRGWKGKVCVLTDDSGEWQTVEDVVELLPDCIAHVLPEAVLALRDEGPVSVVLLPPVHISRLVVALFVFV